MPKSLSIFRGKIAGNDLPLHCSEQVCKTFRECSRPAWLFKKTFSFAWGELRHVFGLVGIHNKGRRAR